MQWSMTKFNACISNVDDIFQAYFIFNNILEVPSWKLVRTGSGRIVALSNRTDKFLLRKHSLEWRCKRWDFIKNVFINAPIWSCVEWWMKSKLKVAYFYAQMTIVLNHLDSWEFALMNPIHKFPRTSFLRDLLDFEVEERSLHILDSSFELFPIF